MATDISKDLIRGHTDTIVLNILAQGDSYGYQIAKTVRMLSQNQYEINEATLYTIFRRLTKADAIESYWGDESQGSRRKYYHITNAGQTMLTDAQAAWDFAKVVIDELVTGQLPNPSGKPNVKVAGDEEI